MKLLLTTVLAAVLFTAAGIAYGYPSLLGPTGQVATPTADVTNLGALRLAATFYNTEDDDLALDNTLLARGTFGLLPILEVGAAIWRADIAGEDLDTISANAKLRLPISLIGGSTAVGAILAQTDVPVGDELTTTYVYIANTRGLLGIPGGSQPFKLTLGANWTQIENGVSVDDIRGFASLQFDLMDTISVAAEYQMESDELGDADPLTSLVGRLGISENFILEGGVTNANPFTAGFTAQDEHNLFVSLIFGWGGE
ncbi:MAG: hypothetical protein ACYC6A_10180 [Armatimonadota bacterium]